MLAPERRQPERKDMGLPRGFNGEITFATDLQVREGFGDEIARVLAIFHGDRFHVSADGSIAPHWKEGLPHIQCQLDLLDDPTLAALWADKKGKDDVNIPVQFSPRGDYRSYPTIVSKEMGHFFFHDLRYASINQ